jgi:hypothetical protein
MIETWSVLNDEQISHIESERPDLVTSLTQFCGCTKEDLFAVLRMRNNKRESWTIIIDWKEEVHSVFYWYKQLSQRTGKKKRQIKIPEVRLRALQKHIKDHLEKIPVSLAASGWKAWDDMLRNAELHKRNPYLITMDLKDAFPSVKTKRVYTNISAALGKAMSVRAPLLDNFIDKDLFVKVITHLVMHNNSLPQWASTSTQVINIVLAKMDSEIQKRIHAILPDFVYSRYIDDIAVSLPQYPTLNVLKQKLSVYVEEIKHITEMKNQWNVEEMIAAFMDSFVKETFMLTDKHELDVAELQIQTIKWLLITAWRNFTCDITEYIGMLDKRKRQICMYGENPLNEIKDQLLEVIGNNWFYVKQVKTKKRTPQSWSMREITWIAYTSEGKRGIPSAKRAAMQRFFNDMWALSSDEIIQNVYYKQFFDMERFDATRVLNMLHGKYAHLKYVYGNDHVPKKLRDAYHQATNKRNQYNIETGGLSSPYDDSNFESQTGDDLLF